MTMEELKESPGQLRGKLPSIILLQIGLPPVLYYLLICLPF